MSRGMAQLGAMRVMSFSATFSFLDLSYPWIFVDGVTDEVYGTFSNTFQFLDTTGPVVFRTLCRSSAAPTGQIVSMAIGYKIVRNGAIVSSEYLPNLNFQTYDLSANKNPGIIDTEWRWITWAVIPAGTFQDGDRVHVRFRRSGGAAGDTLGANLYIHENGFSFFYPVTRPGGLG